MSVAATHPARVAPLQRVRTRARALPAWVVVAAGLSALLGISLALRTTALHAGFWIDEGLSVGISSHPFLDVPSVLRQDGSPPLYYLVLSVWMTLFGHGQAATHILSLTFALLLVPAAFWGARSLFGDRAGWCTAALAALNPFVTYYAQETRMYALVVLLGLLVTVCFVNAFVHGRRRYRVPYGVALAALVYTHNWGLFLAMGTVVALVWPWRARRGPQRRAFVRDVALAYGVTALLYAPWLPSLAFQAAHTGAPWSEQPSLADLLGPLVNILGTPLVPLGLLLAGGAGLAAIAQRGADERAPTAQVARDRTAVWALITIPLAGLALAWLASQASPAFAGRYFAILVGPLLLLSGIGLSRSGRMGLIALAFILVLWFDPRTHQLRSKSDARTVAARISSSVQAGDLVVSVHPEQAPLLHYYFPPNLRYATALGPMPDPGVFDWRDALDRLRAAHPTPTLHGLVRTMHPGQTLILTLPIIRTARWGAPWTALVKKRSSQWQSAADRDPRLRRLGRQPDLDGVRPPRGVRVVLYRVTQGVSAG